MLNIQLIIGNAGSDPEFRQLENACVAKVSVASNESYKDKSGEWQQMTEWHEVVAWNGRAEYLRDKCQKGDLIIVVGKTTHRKYEDKNGVTRYRTEVVANQKLKVVSMKGRSDSNYFPSEEPPANTENIDSTAGVEEGEVVEAKDDDLPF